MTGKITKQELHSSINNVLENVENLNTSVENIETTLLSQVKSLNEHKNDNNNPHNVTPDQISAAKASDVGDMSQIPTQAKDASGAITEIYEDISGVKQDHIIHMNDSVSHVHYAPDTGTANAKVVTLDPVPSAYIDGMAVAFKNAVQNTGAVTINVNGLGAKSVLKSNGNALATGNLKANIIYTLRYNGTAFILQGEGGEYGTATAPDVLSGKTFGTENGVVGGTMPNRGAVNMTLTDFGQQYIIPAGYHNGLGKVIAQIASGKKFATGELNFEPAPPGSNRYDEVFVTGLTFQPRFILANILIDFFGDDYGAVLYDIDHLLSSGLLRHSYYTRYNQLGNQPKTYRESQITISVNQGGFVFKGIEYFGSDDWNYYKYGRFIAIG